MAEFEVSAGAADDLLSIALYTDRTWGRKQARKYATQLESHFEALTRVERQEKAVFGHRDDFHVSRCQHHYVFFVRDEDANVLVLAVLHENMDLLARFRERLERTGLTP